MSLSDGSLSPADVAAVVGNGNNNGFGNWGDGSFWIIILFLFAMFGGWNNGGFGNGGNNAANCGCNQVQRGFDQASVMNSLSGIQSGICNGFANAESAAASRQMATMQQDFATLTAMNQGFSNLQAQQASCCCENRLAVANLGSDIAREACADRQAVSDALAATLNTVNAGIQSIKDQMCQDKIDAKNEEIANLRQQMSMMQLGASQNAQTQAIIANNDLQTAALEQYLAPTPRPAYIVQNPNCCSQNYYNGCGCGA